MEKPRETNQGYDFDVSREAGDLYKEHRKAEGDKIIAEADLGKHVMAAAGEADKRAYKEGAKAQQKFERAEQRAEEVMSAAASHYETHSEAYKRSAKMEEAAQTPKLDPWETAAEVEAEQRIAEDPLGGKAPWE